MAIRGGACPSCGAQIEFAAGASAALVCPYCKHVVVRTERDDLESLGRVADVVFGDDALAPGDHGKFRGQTFVVQGRLVLSHPMGGRWEEYYVVFDAQHAGWIAQAQGRWTVVEQVDVEAPAYDAIEVGQSITLGRYGAFSVVEKSTGTFESAEGELPFAAAPGSVRGFADLSGAGGEWATIDYGQTAPVVFVGVQAQYAELAIERRAGDRPVSKVAVADLKCPKCGAPIALRNAESEHVACESCKAISDVATHEIVLADQRTRKTPKIPLGKEGTLDDVRWTVIGFMTRSATIEGEWFSWSEYLLYAPNEEYRWLVEDEGQWWLGKSIPAGEVTESSSDEVDYQGKRFSLRNRNDATVDFVVGEFYWKVTIGETVQAADFLRNEELVSREANQSEINWTYSRVIAAAVIADQFGVYADRPAGGGAGDDDLPIGKPINPPNIVPIILVGVVILFFVMMVASGGGGGGSGGGWGGGGGFGGK